MDATRFHQLVRRPGLVALGGPPSWLADPSIARALDQPLDSLLDVLATRLGEIDDQAPVASAVLIGLFELNGAVAVLLTRRAATMRREPLTVSFPGGRLHPGERPVEAALRETEEEVGISPSRVRLLGALPLVARYQDSEQVLPVVGSIEQPFVRTPNPDEVDAVLEVPLRSLLVEGVAWTEQWGSPAQAREIRFFAHESELGADLVWGLTARVLWQLLELLAEDGG